MSLVERQRQQDTEHLERVAIRLDEYLAIVHNSTNRYSRDIYLTKADILVREYLNLKAKVSGLPVATGRNEAPPGVEREVPR